MNRSPDSKGVSSALANTARVAAWLAKSGRRLAKSRARSRLSGKPSRARAMAGSITSGSASTPYFRWMSSRPATVPGTPAARCVSVDSPSTTLPSASRNMSRTAAAGARSRWSLATILPSARRITMKPPPPRLPADGYVTASAKPTATAASMALPPAARTSAPTFEATSERDTTMPAVPRIASGLAAMAACAFRMTAAITSNNLICMPLLAARTAEGILNDSGRTGNTPDAGRINQNRIAETRLVCQSRNLGTAEVARWVRSVPRIERPTMRATQRGH